MSDEIQTVDEKLSLLTFKESEAYKFYVKQNKPPMAESTQGGFYALFAQGMSCEEIQRLNPNGFSLGAIVRARLDNNWDDKLIQHQVSLAENARTRLQQIQLETVERLALELAASNKLVSDKVKKFIQTGDVAEIAGMGIGSQRHLKEAIEMLQKLTGQGEKKTVSGVIEHKHSRTPMKADVTIEAEGPRKLTSGQALDLLKLLNAGAK